MKRVCTGCGIELSPDAPQGLCPRCLLQAGFETQTDPASPQGVKAGFAPPEPAALAQYFPQLEVMELLGQGGMGVVYKARQPGLDRLVALKLLSPQGVHGPAFAQRFAQEAKSLARLNHPNIVGVYDFGEAGPYFYLLMEYVDGVNLRQSLRQLAPEQALSIVPKICEALQFAHEEGIVHRDIKPENILLDKKGRVKIADFGLARLLGHAETTERLTRSQQVMGTPQYMAPEQIERPLEVDHRADIYSLGVVFYEMLTGELPMGRFPLPSEKVQIDVRLDDVVLRTLEKEPQRRYQQAKDLKSEVEQISGILETLPPHMRRMFGFDYRTKAQLFGLPLMHVAVGIDPKTGRRRVAKGIIAIGDMAKGVVALGGIAMGFFSMGGLAFGVLPVGGCAIGLLTVGGLGLGLLYSYSGLALAPIAMGGLALGYYSFGGAAFGAHPMGGNAHQDQAAIDFFSRHNFKAVHVVVWSLVALSMLSSMLAPILSKVFSGKQLADSGGGAGGSKATGFSSGAGVPPSYPKAPETSGGANPVGRAKFSKLAILGASWVPFFFVAFFAMYFVRMEVRTAGGEPPSPTLVQNLLRYTLLPLGILAPFGSTILGSVAMSQIRRSRGMLMGLPLALFDALVFPILLLDVVLYWAWAAAIGPLGAGHAPGQDAAWLGLAHRLLAYVLPLVGLLVLDVVIVILAWRRAKRQ